MLSNESLDEFLEGFLNTSVKKNDQQHKQRKIEPEEVTVRAEAEVINDDVEKIAENDDRAKNNKLGKRTWMAIIMIFVMIPLTICFGILIGDRKYYFISMAIIVYTMIPFFMVFEGRKPQARELIVIAVLAAIGVAGRAAFFMLPQFKPVVAIVIIAGISFGAESGFFVGAMTGFVSNFFFGQGPWTPWQMFAFGIIGFLAGILYKKGLLKSTKYQLCIYGFLATFFIYGGLLNMASLFMYSSIITWPSVLAIYISGAPFDLIHAVSTVFFLFIASRAMIEKLERIKKKYGLIER
ncbi:ECF transporter S component [Acetobacterium paludosum]|nr:ECF transporter S component [Acetobacterium paludosum]